MRFLLSSSQSTETNTIYSKNSTTVLTKSNKRALTFHNIHSIQHTDSSLKNKLNRKGQTTKMKPKKTKTKKIVPNTRKSQENSQEFSVCLMCGWPFPHSFRGEEKNVHIDRCMGAFGENDKKFWGKCKGDLKMYLYNVCFVIWVDFVVDLVLNSI